MRLMPQLTLKHYGSEYAGDRRTGSDIMTIKVAAARSNSVDGRLKFHTSDQRLVLFAHTTFIIYSLRIKATSQCALPAPIYYTALMRRGSVRLVLTYRLVAKFLVDYF